MPDWLWYTLFLGGVLLGAAQLTWLTRRLLRWNPYLCPSCGYSRRGIGAIPCPECAAPPPTRAQVAKSDPAFQTDRERFWRNRLCEVPLWLAAIHAVGVKFLFQSSWGALPVALAFMGILAVPSFLVARLARKALPRAQFLGFLFGGMAASELFLCWAILSARYSGDAQSAIIVFIGPIYALAFAAFGSTLGWLIGALIGRATTT